MREILTGKQIEALEVQIIGEISLASSEDPIRVEDRNVLDFAYRGLRDVRLLGGDPLGIDREIIRTQRVAEGLRRDLAGQEVRLKAMLIATGEIEPVIMLPSGREVSLSKKEQ